MELALAQDVGQADKRAAEARLSAADSSLDALDAEMDAAKMAQRDEQVAHLSGRRIREETARSWRQALAEQADTYLSYEAARARWNRSSVKTLSLGLELERMRAYSASSGRAPGKEIQTGRILTRMGRKGAVEERRAAKMAAARHDWERATQAAAALQPEDAEPREVASP